MVSKPRNLLGAPPFLNEAAQRAAPMAPASPEYGCRTTSASGTLLRMKSTWALTTALFRCVPP